MSTPRAAPIQTSSPSRAASSLFPDHSPPLPPHQPSPTPLPSSDDSDTPPPFDPPTTISITSPLTLTQEFLRLSLLLSSTSPHWQARTHSLQCLSDLCQQPHLTHYPNFVPLLHQHRAILVSQLTDRRSAVVKQACATLTAVSAALQRLLLPDGGGGGKGVAGEEGEEHRRVWLSLACDWVEQLLPNIPVTIKVISEATIAAFHAVIAHIAPLSPPPSSTPCPPTSDHPSPSSSPASPDFSLLYTLITGCQHKHSAAREHCYRALSALLARLPSPTLQQQRLVDATEAAAIRQSIAAYRAMTADLTEPSSPLPFSPSAPAGSPLLHALEVALYRGCGDSDAKVRGAARLALMEFAERGSEERGERVLMSMPVSGQRSFEREKQDRMLRGVAGGDAGVGVKEKKLSARERMKAQAMEAKKKGEVMAKTITHSPRSPRTKKSNSGASSPSRASIDYSMGRGDGAILTGGGVIEEEVVVGLGVMEEPKTPPARTEATEAKREGQTETQREGEGQEVEVNRNLALFTRLLDLESPVLTERMQGLLHGDALELLVHFVVRLPSTFDFEHIHCTPPHLLPPTTSGSFPLSSASPLRRRPPPSGEEELTAHRRSFNVMNLLCQPRPSPSLTSILVSKLPLLLTRLLSAFLPQSHANLYHTCAILTHLFTLPSRQPLMTLTSSPTLSSLFLLTFDHLHEGPVPALILTVLTQGDDKERKRQLVASLRKQDVLAVITSRVCQPIDPTQAGEEEGGGELARSAACVDMLQQVMDRVGTAEYLTSFLATIADAGSLIPQLISLVTSSPSPVHPPAQLSAASSLLLSLLSSVEPAQIFVSDPASSSASAASEMGMLARKKIANPLFALKSKALAVLKARLSELCEALVRDEAEEGEIQLNAGRVRHFSSRRMGLLKLVTRACSMHPECCAQLSRAVWEKLLQWFLQWENNNFLLSSIQSLLLQLLQAAPDSPLQTDTLRLLLVDLKLVSRLIGAYHRGHAEAVAATSPSTSAAVSASSSSTALDSTILILCSHLRLTASLHPPSSFLYSHLASHSQWRSFLPTLQHETLLQARAQSLPVSEETLFMRAIQSLGASPNPPPIRGGDGIDIGSRFAYALGYEEEAKAVVGAGGGSGRKARKKKNKAKKRAKAKALEEGEEEGDGDEDDLVEGGAVDEEGEGGQVQQPRSALQRAEEEKVGGVHEEQKSAVIASTK